MMNQIEHRLTQTLWKLYNRPQRPAPWKQGGNLPWNEPDFSRRMLREHLDQGHGAASRTDKERAIQLDWLWDKLGLRAGDQVLDVTCGPGLYAVELAQRGCVVTGVDFSPASIDHARNLADARGVTTRCTFTEQDIRQFDYPVAAYGAALFLYGQLSVFQRDETQYLLKQIARALKPGGKLCVELLNVDRLDKTESNWWYTGNTGLWGDTPFLHLGERFWEAESQLVMERFQIIHLESGQMDEILLCDQAYAIPTMTAMMEAAGFEAVEAHTHWAGLPLYDADEWVVYVAEKHA
jgi:SAM-dependent methyltransferase